VAAPARPVTCDLEPASSRRPCVTHSERSRTPGTGPRRRWRAHPDHLLVRSPPPRRAASSVDTSRSSGEGHGTMPIDAMNSSPDVPTAPGAGLGNPRARPRSRPWPPVRAAIQARADTATAPRHLLRQTRQDQQDDQGGRPINRPSRSSRRDPRKAFVCRRSHGPSRNQRVGRLPVRMDRQGHSCADLDLFDSRSATNPSLPRPGPDFDRADHQRHHPGRRSRLSDRRQRAGARWPRRSAATPRSPARARGCAGTSARTRRQADRRMEAGHGWRLRAGVRHALRHEDRRRAGQRRDPAATRNGGTS
jgi:hypothetical protein